MKRRLTISGVVVSTVILLAMNVHPLRVNAEESGMTKVTTIEGISEYRLENGMKVLLFPDPSSSKVTVNLTLFVGSRHEGYGEAGMAHLLEHMLFKGTPDHPNIPKVLTERGANFNGTTWLDRTNYYETLPASDENLEFAIRMEADRMINSYVKGEDLVSEMTVVRNEFERGENNPYSILFQRMMSSAFQWHNYGQSTIGNRADIERVPIENLKAFYKKYYQPDNAMIVVAGKFETDNALSLIGKHFGVIPAPERELPQTYTEEPAQDGERIVTLKRVGEVSVVGSIYHIPSGGHPDFAATDVMESIMTAEPAGRLYKALVEKQLAAGVYGGVFALHDPGILRLLVEVNEGNEPETVLDAMYTAIEELRENGVTEEEVQRAKQSLLKQRELSASKSSSIAVELSEWAAQGDWRLYFLYRDRVEAVTVEDVNRVAKLYLEENNRTTGIYIPVETPNRISIPATPDLAEMIGDYKGREDVALGEAFDVSPQNIEKRTTRVKLASGIEAALLPKKTRGAVVNLKLDLYYGNAESLQGYSKETEYLPKMMLRGTESLSRQELKDQLDQQLASLSASASAGKATFSIECKQTNLPKVLDILEEVLRKPTFPKAELDILKNAEIVTLEQNSTDPTKIAQKKIGQITSPFPMGDPRYVPSFDEEVNMVKAVTTERLNKLYEEQLNGMYGVLSIVGDFDPDLIVLRIESIVSEWKTDVAYTEIMKPGDLDIKGRIEVVETPDKANATYFGATTLPISDSHPDYPALVIGNFILGGGSLSSRLGDRVRQKDGLSYGVGSGFNAQATNDRALFYLYAITNPDNMEKVIAAIAEEVERIRKDGITKEELAAAQQGYLQEQIVSRSSDKNLTTILAKTEHVDRSMAYYDDLEEKIDAVTAEEVRQALTKYINFDSIYIVTAGDFKKGKKAAE
ncbi:MAG: pitrilysin family protein [Planctomycetaceae bacterium]|nr:pitrilysin family protein [Planctomycetaceae bacterium]